MDKSRVIKTPRVLGIDENHIGGTYRAIFVDIENKMLLEILPDRKKSHVVDYITSLPNYRSIKSVEKELVSGFGVDIEELRTYINNEF